MFAAHKHVGTCRVNPIAPGACTFLLIGATLFFNVAFAASREYDLKAAFIARFVDFVEWPNGALGAASESFRICVYGKDPFGDALDELANLTRLKDRTVKIVRTQRAQALRNCHLLFISKSQRHDLDALLEQLGDAPTLTVGDTAGFSQRGVIINFYAHAETYRFEVNQQAADQLGFKLSARLLKLARITEASK